MVLLFLSKQTCRAKTNILKFATDAICGENQNEKTMGLSD